MKYIIGFVLALLCSVAWAAPPPVTSCIPGSEPSLFGKKRTENGWYALVGCWEANKWKITGAVCRHGVCSQGDWAQAFIDIDTTSDPAMRLQKYTTWWSKIVVTDCDPPANENIAICTEMKAAVAAADKRWNPPPPPPPAPDPVPPPTLWVVAKCTICSPANTRPTYLKNADGTLGKQTTFRATTGLDCDDKDSIVKSGNVYMQPKEKAGVYTLCEKKGI